MSRTYGSITIVDTTDIESIIIEYNKNQSTSNAPADNDSGWSTSRPAWQQGYYIWQRIRIHRSGTQASEDTLGTAVCLTGSTGQTGGTGRSLTGTQTKYTNVALNTTETQVKALAESNWGANVPAYNAAKPDYWVRIKNTYSSGTTVQYIYYKDNGLTSAVSTAAAANATASQANTTAGEAHQLAEQANEMVGRYTILWNYSAFGTSDNGQAYICYYNPITGTKSNESTDIPWVKWNNIKRIITKQMVNPNTIVPYNIPIYIVCRLSSSTATTGTNYMVWYNSKWQGAPCPTATTSNIIDWAWTDATDIVLGKFVEPSSEAAFSECEIYNPPWSAKQVTSNTTTNTGALSVANTALTSANGKNKVVYGSNDPGTTGYVNGDTWFKYGTGDNAARIIGVYKFNGSSWAEQPLTSETFAYIDAGKITAGDIAAARLQAGVISAVNSSTETSGGSSLKISADKVNIEGAAIFTGSGRLSETSLNNTYDEIGAAATAQTAAINAAAADATSKANAAETNAKSYTDTKTSDMATNTSVANTYSTKANTIKRTQRIYYRKSASGTPTTPGTASSNWVTENADKFNTWTKKIPRLTANADGTGTKYLYLYTCEQYELASGTVGYTSVLLDDSTTIIDGGNIITGTVTANQLNADSINVGGFLTIGALTEDTQALVSNDNIQLGGRNLVRGSANVVIGTGSWSTGTFRKSGTGSIETIDISEDSPVAGVNKAIKLTGTTINSQIGVVQDSFPNPLSNTTMICTWWFKAPQGSQVRVQAKWANGDTGNDIKIEIATGNWQRVTSSGVITGQYDAISIAYAFFYPLVENATCLVCAPILEYANKQSNWSPAPEDLQADTVEYIVGTQTAATGAWTGVTRDSALVTGKCIAYKLPYAGSGNASLNLTLSNGSTTGAKEVYLNTTRVTTHFGANAVILMTYDGTRWRVTSIPNSNTVGSYGSGALKAGPNKIYDYAIVMRVGSDTWESLTTSAGAGTSKGRNTSGFYYDKILYVNARYNTSGTGYASGSSTSAEVYAYLSCDLRYSTNCGTTLTTGKPVYIVGIVKEDGLFYLDTTWWTQTEPTSEDGKIYIYIGNAYSTYQIRFNGGDSKIYQYSNGTFRTLANSAKDAIDNIDIDGKNLLSRGDVQAQTTSFTENDYVYQGSYGAGGGLKFPDSLFEVGTQYTLSFKLQKVSGTLTGIGGYHSGFTCDKFVVDGTKIISRTYSQGTALTDDINIHTIEVTLTFNGDVSDNNLYIQPNRGYYSSGNTTTFQIWNIMLERGNVATQWSPSLQDVQNSAEEGAVETANSIVNNLEERIQSQINTIKGGSSSSISQVIQQIANNSLIKLGKAAIDTTQNLILRQAENSTTYMQLAPTALILVADGVPVATIANNNNIGQFIANNCQISTLKMRSEGGRQGQLAWIARENGHLSLKQITD